MATSGPGPDLPTSPLVDLAKLGDGLARWVRLRTMWDETCSRSNANAESVAQLGRLLDDALAQAEADAEALSAFCAAHEEAVDAFVKAAPEAICTARLLAHGGKVASAAGARARAFLAASPAERAFVQERLGDLLAGESVTVGRDAPDVFCEALAGLQFESDVACIRGDQAACVRGERWAELTQEFAC